MRDIEKFISGFKQFKRSYFGENRQLFDQLKQCQQPSTLIISCCDSRVDPAILTRSEPGDLFVVRNVANLCRHAKSGGAPRYQRCTRVWCMYLGVEHIIVLGHSQCGGIRALMEDSYGAEEGGFIAQWMDIAEPAREKVRRELPHKSLELQARACEQAAILLSFPWIAQRVNDRTLSLHGWYFDMSQGELLGYDAASQTLIPL